MSIQSLMKMRELELESEEHNNSGSQSDVDSDICDNDEIQGMFPKCHLITEKPVALNKKYILHIAGTSESSSNVAVALSNHTCVIYNMSNNQFAQLTVLSEHTDVISEVRFCSDNNNLIYTGSNDGSVKLWDLRTPKSSSAQFKDITTENDVNKKQINCFDISPNNRLLAAGTNLFEGDSFILFWDLRKRALLGGYWESHTDDITQVKFHPDDSNKLISGSVDGLINIYDLSQTSEDDALTDSLNTESSIEKLKWLRLQENDVISCITHTEDLQFWKLDDAKPYRHFRRSEVAYLIEDHSKNTYIADVHSGLNNAYILTGHGKCLRGLLYSNNAMSPALGFPQNAQVVRTSWLNYNTNLLLTGGEKGILSAWDMKDAKSSGVQPPQKKK